MGHDLLEIQQKHYEPPIDNICAIQDKKCQALEHVQEYLKGKTDAWIGKDRFGEQLTTEDKTNRDGKTSKAGKNGIASCICEHDSSIRIQRQVDRLAYCRLIEWSLCVIRVEHHSIVGNEPEVIVSRITLYEVLLQVGGRDSCPIEFARDQLKQERLITFRNGVFHLGEGDFVGLPEEGIFRQSDQLRRKVLDFERTSPNRFGINVFTWLTN